jgi:hypothetical protein
MPTLTMMAVMTPAGDAHSAVWPEVA